jgi:hypothetical protein
MREIGHAGRILSSYRGAHDGSDGGGGGEMMKNTDGYCMAVRKARHPQRPHQSAVLQSHLV